MIVPFPFSSERHQDFNAKQLGDAGAAVVIEDRDLNKDRLMLELKRILSDKELYSRMQAMCRTLTHDNASLEIVNIIYGMLKLDLPTAKKKRTGRPKRSAKNAD